jgi:ribosome-binding protein aMBF1 (putative translation factor)
MENKEILDKLEQIVSKEPSKWHEESQYRIENKQWLKRSQAVAFKVLRTLREQGSNQKELALKIGVSAQQVNKWVKGTENFTFETIAKLEHALQVNLMSITGFENSSKSSTKIIQNVPYYPQTTPKVSEYAAVVNAGNLKVVYNKYDVKAVA